MESNLNVEKKLDRQHQNTGAENSNNNGEVLIEKLVKINRCTKVVKGGRRFSFSVLMIVGNKKGKVGIGFGKANEISDAIQKSIGIAKKNMISVFLKKKHYLPHEVNAKFCASKVWIKPASQGTGLIAGGSVRILLELLGVQDIISKIRGNRNTINVLKAAFLALKKIQDPKQRLIERGKFLNHLYHENQSLN